MIKKNVLFLTFLLSLFLTFVSQAQEVNYRHFVNDDGEIVFIQKLEWKKYENIDHYRIELEEIDKTSKKATVLDKNIEENSIELTLKSGTYRYRISVFNVLGKLEARSNWLEFEVFKATKPKITSVLPNEIEFYETDENKVFTIELSGENLLRESKYRIIDKGGMTEGKLVFANGDCAKLNFDFTGFQSGEYEIFVKNPGGLEEKISINVLVKEIEPPEPEEPEEPEEVPIEEEPEEIQEPEQQEAPKIEDEELEENPEVEKNEDTPQIEEKSEQQKEPENEQIKEDSPIEDKPEPVQTKEEPQIKDEPEPEKKEKEKLVLDFDLDVALGTAFVYQVMGKQYIDGKFYKEFFGKDFIFPVISGKISFLPFKTNFGNFGIGLSGDFAQVKVSKDRRFKSYDLSGNIISGVGLLVYQKPLSTKFTLELHSGAGISLMNNFTYSYSTPRGNYDSKSLNSTSTIIDAGFSVQFNIYKGLFAEIGSDFVYNTSLSIGNLEPKIHLGWKF